jgi:hypothetical protein
LGEGFCARGIGFFLEVLGSKCSNVGAYRFVSPGAVEIRAKKIVDAIQGNAVISLRGDFDLTRLQGSITYVEQNQTTKKIDTAFIDLNCK